MMSDINLNFDVSPLQANWTVSTTNITIEPREVNLTFATAGLTLDVQGTGAYYNAAKNNQDEAESAANVVVSIPAQTITANGGMFAVAEYTITGTTEAGTGTPTVTNFVFSGNLGTQPTIPEQANAVFQVSGITPVATAADATAANANFVFSGNTSANNGNNTVYNIDIRQNIDVTANGTLTVQLPAYGSPSYPVLNVSTPLVVGANANSIVANVSTNLIANRISLSTSTSIFQSAGPEPTGFTFTPDSANTLVGIKYVSPTSYVFVTQPNAATLRIGSYNTTPFTINSYLSGLLFDLMRASPSGSANQHNVSFTTQVNTVNNISLYYTSTENPTASDWLIASVSTSGTQTGRARIIGNQIFIPGKTNTTPGRPVVYYSFATNPTTWSSVNFASTAGSNNATMSAITINPSRYVYYLNTGNIWYANTLTAAPTQDTQKIPGNNTLIDAATTGTQDIVLDNNNIYTRAASNNATWTTRYTNNVLVFRNIQAFANGYAIATGSLGKVVVSKDHGNTWTDVSNLYNLSLVSKIQQDNDFTYLYGSSATALQTAYYNYERLTVNNRYGSTAGSMVISTAVSGTNTQISTSTIQGTVGTQLQDIITFADNQGNLSTFLMPYSLNAVEVAGDIISRSANSTRYQAFTAGNSNTRITTTRLTTGFVANANVINVTYTTGSNGGSSASGNLVATRDALYNGSNNSAIPAATISFTLDTTANAAIATIQPNTNLSTFNDWPNLLSNLNGLGYTVTQGNLGNFTVTRNANGAIADLDAIANNFTATFSNVTYGNATITRTSFANGGGSVLSNVYPTVSFTFPANSGYSPNPYVVQVPWANGNAANVAATVRSGSVIGATISGTGNTVIFTATDVGNQAYVTSQIAGQNLGNLAATFSNANSSLGTGDVPKTITINGISYSLPATANPETIIQTLIANFYDDNWRISRTGASQFSLTAAQLGPKTAPTVSTSSNTVSIANTYINGTNIVVNIPGANIDLGKLSVLLPGITLYQQ